MSTTRKYLVVAGIFALLVAGGCANTATERWTERMLRAANAQDRGNRDEARETYLELLESDTPDEASKRKVMIRLGDLLGEEGDIEDALEWYGRASESAGERVYDPIAARASYRRIELLEEANRIDSDERAERCWTLVESHPDSLHTEFCLDDIEHNCANRSEIEAVIERYGALADEIEGGELEGRLRLRRGKLLLEKLDRPRGAFRAFRNVYDWAPDHHLAEEALWEMAQLYITREQWRPAIRALEILAAEVESGFIGHYNSPYASDSRRKIGLIYLLFLDAPGRALEQFEIYERDFPHSIELDDVYWHRAHAHRLAGEPEKYRSALRDLRETFPKSRYIRIIDERLDGERDAESSH